MAERDLEQKFDELFALFSEIVTEMGGQSETLLFGRYGVRHVAFRVAGRKFILAAERVLAAAHKSEPYSGMQAMASLLCGDRKVAGFRLHAKEWVWKLARDPASLVLGVVDAETIREVLQAALESGHE